MKYRPESIVRGWSPRRWPSGSWWLCRWSSPPSVCCRWPPPAWQLWSRYDGQWECFHGPCSEHDGHSHRFLIGPEPAKATEDKDNTVRAVWFMGHKKVYGFWLIKAICVCVCTSTLVGQHSTALLNMILASSGSSSSTAIFHKRTDFDTFSRAVHMWGKRKYTDISYLMIKQNVASKHHIASIWDYLNNLSQ